MQFYKYALNRKKLTGIVRVDERGIHVLEGSLASGTTKQLSDSAGRRRTELLADERLVEHNGHLRFTANVRFSSLSNAANVVTGGSRSGNEFFELLPHAENEEDARRSVGIVLPAKPSVRSNQRVDVVVPATASPSQGDGHVQPSRKARQKPIREFDGRKAIEGYLEDFTSKRAKRDKRLADQRKADDKYVCQACGFKLIDTYEGIDIKVIDCHHLDELSKGPAVTTLDRLVSLCPNCHRLAHIRRPALKLEQIREILKKNKLPTFTPTVSVRT